MPFNYNRWKWRRQIKRDRLLSKVMNILGTSFLIIALCSHYTDVTLASWPLTSHRHIDRWLNMMIIQYIPRNMHTVFALLCFVVVIHWLIFPYPSGLLHWHCGNLTIAPVPAKQPWWIWINTSCEFIMNDCITTTKQSTTKPCAYFLGYTVQTTKNTSQIRNAGPLCGEYTGYRCDAESVSISWRHNVACLSVQMARMYTRGRVI